MVLLSSSDVEVQARVRRASSQSRSPERRSPLQYDAAPRYLNEEDSKHSDGSSSAGSPVATSASRAVEEPDELNDFEKELEALHTELHAQEKKKRMEAGAEMKADGDSQQERSEEEDDSSEEEEDRDERFERRSSRGATREWCHQQ